MKSAVNKIFWGLILSCIALSIGVIPLCNDLIGIIIAMAGLKYFIMIEDDKKYFMKTYRACAVLLVFLILVDTLVKAKSKNVILNTAVIPSIGISLKIFIYYYFIKGLKEKAKNYSEIVRRYNLWWKAILLVNMSLLIYLPFEININGTSIGSKILGATIIIMLIIKVLFALSFRENEYFMITKEIENEG